MQTVTVQSVSGLVSIITDGVSRNAQVGDQIALNSVLVTAANGQCHLSHAQGSLMIGAQQKLLLDQDVFGLNIDSDTEAVTSSSGFRQAIVQIALSDPGHILSQLLSNLNSLLNQSLDKTVFSDSHLLEDHSLYLDLAAEQMQAQDLLADHLDGAAGRHYDLSLEEAISGEAVQTLSNVDYEVSHQATFGVENPQVLVNILESSRDYAELDGLIEQLVQVMDLSSYFSRGGPSLMAADSLVELVSLSDEESYLGDNLYHSI